MSSLNIPTTMHHHPPGHSSHPISPKASGYFIIQLCTSHTLPFWDSTDDKSRVITLSDLPRLPKNKQSENQLVRRHPMDNPMGRRAKSCTRRVHVGIPYFYLYEHSCFCLGKSQHRACLCVQHHVCARSTVPLRVASCLCAQHRACARSTLCVPDPAHACMQVKA